MDRKSIIVLIASFALLGGVFWVAPILYPPVPRPAVTNLVARATNQPQPGSITNAAPIAPPTLAETSIIPAVSSLAGPLAGPQGPEQLEKIETPEAVYTFTSRGGGLKLVELKKYLENIGSGSQRSMESNQWVALNARAQVPALALRGATITDGGAFKLVRLSPVSVQAEQSLSNGLAIIKLFTMTSNYLVTARVRIENRADRSVALPEHSWSIGTSSSASRQDDPTMLGAMWHDGASAQSVAPAWFDNRGGLSCVTGGGPMRSDYPASVSNLLWAAVQSQFFAIALMPSTNQPASQLLVHRFELPSFLPGRNGAPAYGYEASLVYPGATLAPAQALERDFILYAGPKEYKTLSRIGRQLDVIMGYTGFFGWFAKALLLSMNGLYSVVPSYGMVIILITVIIKLLFWPLTQSSTRSMKRMQTLQPQMKALQEKYKEDPAKMNKKLMEFMKENKVSPLGGCLPMLLQIPVFIGFFQMIRSAIELRGARFLWAADLSRADTLFSIPWLDWVPFFGVAGVGLPVNPLPLIMGATMLWQARMTPPSPGMDPSQQKIMKYMPMMFMVFLYNYSAGLTLYWTVQNLLTIAQMKLTKTQSDKSPAPAPAPPAAASKKRKQP
jgi:YidC/Oxa1 family membrane protein insertase